MGKHRKVYAFVMVAIYLVATLLSSLSLLTCDHHHPHHHTCKSECCSHVGVAISSDCCNHEHPVLGDNHTDFISKSYRSDSRVSAYMVLAWVLAPAMTSAIVGEQTLYERNLFDSGQLYTIGSEQDSHVLGLSLRAPPMLA